MIDNITNVYFTDEWEYISSDGPLLKYIEQAKMIQKSMVYDGKVLSESFTDSAPVPFGTLTNFLVTTDWHTIYNECRILQEEYSEISDTLQSRKIPLYDGFKAFMDETELYPYFKAVFLINNIYDELCKFSSDMAELFIQCTVTNYKNSLFEYAGVSDFFSSIGFPKENIKEIVSLAFRLIDDSNGCIIPLLLSNAEICGYCDSSLIAVMYYITERLSADLRELSVCAENIKKSASEIIEADKKSNGKMSEILSVNRLVPRVNYDGISQISEEYFEAYSKSSWRIPIEDKLKYKQIQKIKAVRFNSLYSAVCYELNHIYFIGSHLSKCEACGKYFASKTTKARYCSDCVKQEQYAKQYVNIDEYKKLYLKNNKAYNARYNRDKSIGDKYHNWQENAQKLLKEAQDGAYTLAEFSEKIALPISEKKARHPKK